jgi:hypothetical protein
LFDKLASVVFANENHNHKENVILYGGDKMNTITLNQSQHLKKQTKFVKERIKSDTKEDAKKRLIDAGILNSKGEITKHYK